MPILRCKAGHTIETGYVGNHNYKGFSVDISVSTPGGTEFAITKTLCIYCLANFLNQSFSMTEIEADKETEENEKVLAIIHTE